MLLESNEPLTDLPAGRRSRFCVQPRPQKYSCSRLTQITSISLAVPAQHRGAFRDRHERRAGDAVDAGCAFDESAGLRTAKSCGPDAPTLASSVRSNPQATVANKPGHRGEREAAVKTIACGNAG